MTQNRDERGSLIPPMIAKWLRPLSLHSEKQNTIKVKCDSSIPACYHTQCRTRSPPTPTRQHPNKLTESAHHGLESDHVRVCLSSSCLYTFFHFTPVQVYLCIFKKCVCIETFLVRMGFGVRSCFPSNLR